MCRLMKIKYLLLIALAAAATASASELTVVSYEPAETSIEPYIITLLASYEDGEFDHLSIGSNAYGGTCTVTNPLASSEGLTATDGDYILKLDIVNAGKPGWVGDEARGKVEISHTWSEMTFDVGGAVTEILYDIYFAPGTTSMSVTGLWDSEWLPNTWFSGGTVDTTSGTWHTITIDVSSVTPITTNNVAAMVFEGLRPIVPAGTGTFTGVIYVDNLRSRGPNPGYVIPAPDGVVAGGHEKRIDIVWQPVSAPGLLGYNIYSSSSAGGPFTKLNSSPHPVMVYSDFFGTNDQTYHYYVTAVGGDESAASAVVSATSYAMTDDELLESVQEATFRFFWDFGHPVSGLAREGYNLGHSDDTCAIGGTGMGLMAICVGTDRGFVSRAEAAERILKILTFLDEDATRYHGAWSHWVNGATGATIPFSPPVEDDGGDIVETSYLAQGILTVRQYFDSNAPVETQVRSLATALWEEIDWYWYLRRSDPGYESNERLYWHWSSNYGWAMNMPVIGYNECMITYLLAIASPTHPIPASCYYNGWASGTYKNGSRYYGYTQWVGGFELPMFFTHYTHLGFDPRDKSDNYCNYFENSRNIALIDQAYCIDNPNGFTGYSDLVWGLTASFNPWGYGAHAPGGADNGTISPTAALSSTPYTPDESIATLKHFYHTYGGDGLWGPFGFVDAFNLGENWFAPGYVAIDQGPIVVMIENFRTQLCWDLFMANPEIAPMLESIGWATRADNGLNYEYYEGTWTLLPNFDSLTPIAVGKANNFDIGLRQRDDYFALRFTGYINIQTGGEYTFYTNSNDGSKLYIDGSLVVNNDGRHGTQERSGTVSLPAGKHLIVVTYFEYDGEQGLIVSYSGPGISKKQIPVNVLFRCDLAGDFSGDCHIDMNDLKILAANWLNDYNFIDFSEMAANWME